MDEINGQLAEFCSTHNIQSCCTPEHAPHFGGLWEAAVKSFKYHFRKIVGGVRLNFEELTTVLTQIKACLNPRPLTPLPQPEDGIEALTPGYILVGAPLDTLPYAESSTTSIRPIFVDY